MNKILKIFVTVLMVMLVICTSTPMVFAAPADIVTQVDKQIDEAGKTGNEAASELTRIAGQVVNLIQIASAVAAVVLIAVFGFKFILGSANEKADYQKSFIPLIVGVVVVFAATSIAKLLFGLIG